MTILKNDNFKLINDNGKLLIKVFRATEIKDFSTAITVDPRISITKFSQLKDALTEANSEEIPVGVYKDEIEIDISGDKMQANLILNMTRENYNKAKKTIINDILSKLFKNGIDSGIDHHALEGELELLKKIPVAKGFYPVNVKDSKITYYKLSEKKPTISTDGKADHYSINLIDEVKAGDWLGERTPYTSGSNGRNIFGEEIPAKPGRDYQFKYDRESIEEIKLEDGSYQLIAKIDGAVTFKGTKISVDNHLVINGDVDYSTGNINFNGSVTIEGIVEDTFSVVATKDISINGDMGIGSVELIESTEGNVFIKGGVNGKSNANVKAKKNVYLKYVNEANILAGDMINIGLYAYDSTLQANKIILCPYKGKIVGGKVTANHLVEAASIGNRSEKRTDIEVKGFNRKEIDEKLETINNRLVEIISKANMLKRKLEIFELNQDRLDDKARNSYKMLFAKYEAFIDEIQELNAEIQLLEDVLATRGDGEVKVYSSIYPKSMLEIKRLQHKVNTLMKCSFYVKNNTLHKTNY